jgi:hypothetical protein
VRCVWRLFELALRLPKPVRCRLRLCLRLGIACRRATKGIGGFACRPRGFAHLGPLLFARQPLETPRDLVELIGHRALLCRAPTTAALSTFQGATTGFALRLLLLAAREFLQLLEHLIDLPIGLLLRRLGSALVAARHLIEFLLEQILELLLHGATTAPRRRPAGRVGR